MRLVAGLLCRNEASRVLPLVIEHLRGLCDRVVVLDDASDDGTYEWLDEQRDEQLVVSSVGAAPIFYKGEDSIRQWLLERCVDQSPTHILIQDADELVGDRAALRARLEERPDAAAWSLTIREAWKADAGALYAREDGGWRSHPLAGLFKAPSLGDLHAASWRYPRKNLAVGRVPAAARRGLRPSGVDLWHLGWLDETERVKRHARYVEHDNGRFHARKHLDSILWPDALVRLTPAPWPEANAFRMLRARYA
jgi:hypothetical protein